LLKRTSFHITKAIYDTKIEERCPLIASKEKKIKSIDLGREEDFKGNSKTNEKH